MKPSEVYDREEEWAALTRFVSDQEPGATLGLVYGRRRQGKSLLLESACEVAGGFYHPVLEEEAAPALRSLGESLGRFRGLTGGLMLNSWGQAIDALLGVGGDRALPVVLDEFPYLIAAAPELPSLIQRAFGPRARRRVASRARLVLCGSAVSVMGRLLSGPAPLRGRAALDLIVQPFDFRQAAGFWGVQDDPGLAFRLHAVVGGTPAYKDLLRGDKPVSASRFDAWVARAVLHPASPLFREGRYLLSEEPGLTDRALYHSILSAIANGCTRPGQIAAAIGRPQTSLSHPLNVLEDIRLVRKEDDVLRQRRPTYRITEPIVSFYFAVIRPHLARLERGAGVQVWTSDARATFAAQILGPHFEELARLWTGVYASAGTMGGEVGTVGAAVIQDVVARRQQQLDVVALAPTGDAGRKRLLALGEAKWRAQPVGVAELERLTHARRLLQARADVDASAPRLLLFSGSGFTPELSRRSGSEVVLVDLDRLYRGD